MPESLVSSSAFSVMRSWWLCAVSFVCVIVFFFCGARVCGDCDVVLVLGWASSWKTLMRSCLKYGVVVSMFLTVVSMSVGEGILGADVFGVGCGRFFCTA